MSVRAFCCEEEIELSSGKVSEPDSGIGVGAILGFCLGGIGGALIGAVVDSAFSESRSSSYSSRSSYSSYSSSYVDYEAQRRREQARQEAERQREQQRIEREIRAQQRRAEEERRRREEEERRRREEAERQRQMEEERQRMIAQAWRQTQRALQAEIDGIRNAPERKQLAASLKGMEASYRQAMTNRDSAKAESIVNDLRKKISFVQMDEKVLDSQKDELSRFLSRLKKDAPAGFSAELEALGRGESKPGSSIEEQMKQVKALMGKARYLAGEISQANAISIDGLSEETFFIPPVVDESRMEAEAIESAALLGDICDFGGRVAFFSEDEAERLKPLVLEAKQGANAQRLKLIRSQVKTTYGRLREQAILTDMFKRDFRDFLPPMRKASGTESLCVRMEDLLTAPVVSREEYNDIYKAVKGVFEEQMDTITDAMFAEMIEKKLTVMGYKLMDENGNPAGLPPGEMRMLSTPYEGYRVRVKVNKNNTVATRLVRVVGSEEEKASVSEYQRQKDIETGKLWKQNIEEFYRTLGEEGLPMKIVFSKDPGEEPLDIIVDKSAQIQRRTAVAEQRQGQLQETALNS